MDTENKTGNLTEKTLDPEDWSAFRRSAHNMLDTCLDHLESLPQGPVWQPVPDAVKQQIAAPLPSEGLPLDEVLSDFTGKVLPYATGNGHPRFFGWVHGTGTPAGVLAEMCAATMNSNCGGRDHGAIYIERQIIEWCRQIFSFPEGAGGILTTGTSTATLIGLVTARTWKLGAGFRKSGPGTEPQLAAYASEQAHSANAKAVEVMGLGSEWLRRIPADEAHGIDAEALRRAIEDDIRNGYQPFCVIGTVGTVNTGGSDDLRKLSEICKQYELWLHVDGAFGAWARLADQPWRNLAEGIEEADSLAFDFHKWMYVQYDAGCVLIKDAALHRAAFAARPDYLQHVENSLGGGDPWFCDLGIDLSRSFRALKVWFTLRHYGFEELGRQITGNCRQARYLADLVARRPELELLAPVSLNICCFRYIASDMPDERLDELNRDIVVRLQGSGIAAPSTTRVQSRLAIRVAITNHRTRLSDLELLCNEVLRLGNALSSGR